MFMADAKEMLLGKLTLNIEDIEKKTQKVNDLLSSIGQGLDSNVNLQAIKDLSKELGNLSSSAPRINGNFKQMESVLKSTAKSMTSYAQALQKANQIINQQGKTKEDKELVESYARMKKYQAEMNSLEKKNLSAGKEEAKAIQDRLDTLRTMYRAEESYVEQKERNLDRYVSKMLELDDIRSKGHFLTQQAQAQSADKAEAENVGKLAKMYTDLFNARAQMARLDPKSNEYDGLSKKAGNIADEIRQFQQLHQGMVKVTEVQNAITDGKNKLIQATNKQADAVAKQGKKADLAEYNKLLKEQYEINRRTKEMEDYGKGNLSSQEKIRVANKLIDLAEERHNVETKLKVLESEGADSSKKAEYAQRLVNYENQLAEKRERGNRALEMQSSLWEKITMSVVHLATSALWNSISRGFQDAVTYAKEFNGLLNEIRIVTGATEEQAELIGDKYIQMAQNMSVNSKDIASAAVEFYRQGLSDDEVENRLINTTQYAKIAGLEFEEAATIVTAAANSMNLDVQRVVDVFSYLGDASASG